MTLLEKATKILSRAYGGEHHIPGQLKDKGRIIECNVYDQLSTYDNTVLTRLVLGAHDECCRLEIRSGGPRLLKLCFSDRKRPGECGEFPLMYGHATIEDAIFCYRHGDRGQQFVPRSAQPNEASASTAQG